MRHRLMTLALATAAAALLTVGVLGAPSASASGGGGCGRPVTDATGTTIAIRSYCFTPTILRVPVGGTVTWANQDPVPHTVLGANGIWGGYAMVKYGEEVTYRFTRPGVFPYVCTYHPGMVGAVVVGSASGPGAAGTTTTGSGPVAQVFGLSTPAPAGPASSVVEEARDHGSGWRTVALAAIALVVALGAGLATSGRRNRTEAS